MRTLMLALCVVGMTMAGCATSARESQFQGTPGLEQAQARNDREIYSTRGGAHGPNSAAPSAPNFQCCESAIEVPKAPKNRDARVANARVNTPAGAVSQLQVGLRLKLEFDCALVEGEPDCVGNFASITVNRHPGLRPAAGGALVQPVAHRVWWTQSIGDCDGKRYKAKITVLYIGRYNTIGVPGVQAGNAETLVLDLTAPRDAAGQKKGKDYRVTLELAQRNANANPTATVKEWTER